MPVALMSLLRLLVCLEHDARTFLSRALPQVGLLLLEHPAFYPRVLSLWARAGANTHAESAGTAAFAVKEKFAVALIPIIPARQQP
jgi:hypothetical protein